MSARANVIGARAIVIGAPAVVIGADANGLVAAHTLARAGHRALVLDPRAADAADGESASGWVPEPLARDFGLEGRGWKVERPDPWLAAPLPGGGRLELSRDMARSVEAIRPLSPRDAARWPEFCERMRRLGHLLEMLYLQPPPNPTGRGMIETARLAGLGLVLRGLGRQGIGDLLRLIPMSAADFLDDWFESDALKGALATAGIIDLAQGPRSGGTALRLLHHHVGNPPGVFRPPRSNLVPVLEALPGIEVRRAAVGRIAVRHGGVAGVVLADGEEIPTTLVVSGVDARRTLLELADPQWLDPQLARALRNVRARGVAGRVTLAFERAPAAPTLVVAPSLDYLERAYDDSKYARVSQAPYLEARSNGQTADGRHRMTVRVQYAPYAPAAGDWDEARGRALGELARDVLARHAPELGAGTVEQVWTPRDLEEQYGYPQGQPEHAEPALDQLLWMRPIPELARYATPISGLYLCGPGSHPCGSIAGAAGYLAARAVLRDQKSA